MLLKLFRLYMKGYVRVMLPMTTFLNKILLVQFQKFSLYDKLLRFKSRPDDLFLCTYPKSGTTWLQQILYQLTTDGDMDKIDHISIAVPHFEESQVNLAAMPSPRVFKTHLWHFGLPLDTRCIYVARDGRDVANSFYYHMQAAHYYGGSFESFFETFMRGHVPYGGWFKHLKKWSKQRNNPNVLFLNYEDMLADTEKAIRQIAAFAKIEIDESQMPRILERSSFAFMKQHNDKMDLRTLRVVHLEMQTKNVKVAGLIREGKAGKGKEALSPDQLARFNSTFDKNLAGKGWDCYRD